MKYLYILVYSESGFYIEQTYVSMLSLKHVSPNAYITLLVDDETDKNNRNHFFDSIKQLTSEYKVVQLDKNMPSVAKSRFLKTTMRQIIEGDFLYVDSDTIWASPINEADFTFDIMGVLDGNCFLEDNPVRDYIQSVCQKTNFLPKSKYYVNGGVMYSKDTPFSHEFFKKWHDNWLISSKDGCFVDQPSLNALISETASPEAVLLPGMYNAQITFSWDYFFNAKIIHYFTYSIEHDEKIKSPYILKNKDFWQKISVNGITDDVIEIINNPLIAFSKGFKIISQEENNFKHTYLYGFAKDLYMKKIRGQKSRFDFFEKILSIIAIK